MTSQTNKISMAFSPMLSIIKEAPFMADSERLIDMTFLMRQSLCVEDNKRRDEDLIKWHHQAELHDIWAPNINDSK